MEHRRQERAVPGIPAGPLVTGEMRDISAGGGRSVGESRCGVLGVQEGVSVKSWRYI